jgi:hypothetical protein
MPCWAVSYAGRVLRGSGRSCREPEGVVSCNYATTVAMPGVVMPGCLGGPSNMSQGQAFSGVGPNVGVGL